MFWKKKPLESLKNEEYEKILNRISEIKHQIEEVKTKCELLETNYNDLRGKFNRKLSILKEEMDQPEIPKSLNTFSPFGK